MNVHTAASNVVVVELTDSDNVNMDSPDVITAHSGHAVDVTPAKWSVSPLHVNAVHRYTIPRDQSRKGQIDQLSLITLRHRIYLVLASGESLQENTNYQVTTPYGSTSFTFSSRSTYCESIHVNQAAYDPHATSSFGNLGVYMGGGGSLSLSARPTFDIVNDLDGSVPSNGLGLTADAVRNDTSGTSGENVYRLRLPANLPDGRFFISVRGFGRSHSFGVGERYSREIAKLVTRGLYHQRCGIALSEPYTHYTRPACHTKMWDAREDVNHDDGDGLDLTGNPWRTDFSGGYHDAGDFDRRPMHTIIPILMLSYFEAFPSHFVDGQYNIPESGNGIPDFLDEALWGLKGWENLQITDSNDPDNGAVRPGTGDAHPEYGYYDAATDPTTNTTYAVADGDDPNGDGADTGDWNPRSVTALCAGMFAQASRLLASYAGPGSAEQAHANELLQRAQRAWNYLEQTRHLTVDAPRGRYLYAALQLYLATGESKYRGIFEADANAMVVSTGTYPNQYLPGNRYATIQTAHFISYLLTSHGRPTDATLVQNLKAVILSKADSGGEAGPAPESLPYPRSTNQRGWGANTAMGQFADVYAFATLFAKSEADRQRYYNAVSQYADYSLGLNPIGVSYYTGVKEYFAELAKSDSSFTGLGADEVLSPLHDDSYYTKYGVSDGLSSAHQGNPIGNVPGILVYGPGELSEASYQAAVYDQIYPDVSGMPLERQWGDGWSMVNSNEFSTWQTIVWAAVMHGFLYNAGATPPTPICGNGVCESGESAANCSQDCGMTNTCGDGTCQSAESTTSCPGDCYCGNGRCDSGETAASCPQDCGTTTTCGDGTCQSTESTTSCPSDCYCGNGRCDSGESATNCSQDCGTTNTCGDGTCQSTESTTSCSSDCYCGNGRCDSGETAASCPRDCSTHGSVIGQCGLGGSGGGGLLLAGLAWLYTRRRRALEAGRSSAHRSSAPRDGG